MGVFIVLEYCWLAYHRDVRFYAMRVFRYDVVLRLAALTNADFFLVQARQSARLLPGTALDTACNAYEFRVAFLRFLAIGIVSAVCLSHLSFYASAVE